MTDSPAARAYDEFYVAKRLDGMAGAQRIVFSIACSQILWSAYCRISQETGSERPAVFDEALAELWSMAKGEREAAGISAFDPPVFEASPHDDSEDWTDSSGFLQSTGIALINAINGVATGSWQNSVFAARQISEIAEYIVDLAKDDAEEEGASVDEEYVLNHAKNLVYRQVEVVARWHAGEPIDINAVVAGCQRDGEDLGAIALREINFEG